MMIKNKTDSVQKEIHKGLLKHFKMVLISNLIFNPLIKTILN